MPPSGRMVLIGRVQPDIAVSRTEEVLVTFGGPTSFRVNHCLYDLVVEVEVLTQNVLHKVVKVIALLHQMAVFIIIRREASDFVAQYNEILKHWFQDFAKACNCDCLQLLDLASIALCR